MNVNIAAIKATQRGECTMKRIIEAIFQTSPAWHITLIRFITGDSPKRRKNKLRTSCDKKKEGVRERDRDSGFESERTHAVDLKEDIPVQRRWRTTLTGNQLIHGIIKEVRKLRIFLLIWIKCLWLSGPVGSSFTLKWFKKTTTSGTRVKISSGTVLPSIPT